MRQTKQISPLMDLASLQLPSPFIQQRLHELQKPTEIAIKLQALCHGGLKSPQNAITNASIDQECLVQKVVAAVGWRD